MQSKMSLAISDDKPILREIAVYAEKCISGDIPSGQKHKWACERLLRDIDADKWAWDESEAERIVTWFSYLRHSKGVLAGEPIILTDWQRFRICQIYGWRDKTTGLRRFTRSYVQVGRKNAKSQEEAGIALYEISRGATKNGEFYEAYSTGVKREQSKIVYNEAKLMLRGTPLEPKFRIKRDEIIHRKTGSFFRPLSKEDGKRGDGTNPALFIIDEYHQHPNDDFYSVGAQGMNTREPLMMIITTAGVDLTYPCYVQEYAFVSRLLDPDDPEENDAYFADVMEMDMEDDPTDERNWEKANPIRMSYEKGRELIRQNFRDAVAMPEKMPNFLTKSLNRWVMSKQAGYMDLDKWHRCRMDQIPYELEGAPVYVGIDMSSKIDLTSVAFLFPIETDDGIIYGLKSHSFAPNLDKLIERETKDRKPYRSWYQQGYLSITDSPVIDQAQVIEYVEAEVVRGGWDVQCIAVDPNNATMLEMALAAKGYEVEEVYQSHRSLNDSTKGFRDAVYSQRVIYETNPLLDYAMANAVVKSSNGFIKIDKDANDRKIDPVDATLCAFKLAMYHKPAEAWDEFTF